MCYTELMDAIHLDKQSVSKPLTSRWWFRAVLIVLFVFVPPYAVLPHDSSQVSDITAATLAHPLAYEISWLLPIAKLLLLAAVIAPLFIGVRRGGRWLLGYYSLVLIIVAIFQNMAQTEQFGDTWLIGSTLVQLVVAAVCIYDLRRGLTGIDRSSLALRRVWLVPLMALAYLMPYAVNASGHVYPSLAHILTNEPGLTYCMITPIVIGMMLLFPGKIHKPTLSLISFTGLLFAIANMMTWFVLRPADWWMGVLHLPLLLTSIYGLWEARLPRYKK